MYKSTQLLHSLTVADIFSYKYRNHLQFPCLSLLFVGSSSQETASGSGGKTEDRLDPRPATDTALSWPQNRKQAQSSENRGALFPFEMEHM